MYSSLKIMLIASAFRLRIGLAILAAVIMRVSLLSFVRCALVDCDSTNKSDAAQLRN